LGKGGVAGTFWAAAVAKEHDVDIRLNTTEQRTVQWLSASSSWIREP